MLSVYLDGSGKTDGRYSALTLAGVAVSEMVRAAFEASWQDALRRLGLPWWHTTDARRRWKSEPKAFFKAVEALFQALEPFRDQRLWAYSATVVLDDYARARREMTLRAPEALCVDGSVGSLGYKDEKDLPIVLYFDQGEEFRKHIQRVWEAARARKREWRYRRPRGWVWQVERIASADSRESCGLQAADLLAWLVNRHHSVSRDEAAPSSEQAEAQMRVWATHFFFKHFHRVIDYDYIVKRYGRAGSPSV